MSPLQFKASIGETVPSYGLQYTQSLKWDWREINWHHTKTFSLYTSHSSIPQEDCTYVPVNKTFRDTFLTHNKRDTRSYKCWNRYLPTIPNLVLFKKYRHGPVLPTHRNLDLNHGVRYPYIYIYTYDLHPTCRRSTPQLPNKMKQITDFHPVILTNDHTEKLQQ